MRSKAFYERPWCPVRNPRGGGQANRWSSESRPPFLWPARTAGTDALLPRPRVVASRNSKLAVTMTICPSYDRRANQVVLTKQGADVVGEIAPHMAAVLDRVFHDTLNDMPGVCGEAGFEVI